MPEVDLLCFALVAVSSTLSSGPSLLAPVPGLVYFPEAGRRASLCVEGLPPWLWAGGVLHVGQRAEIVSTFLGKNLFRMTFVYNVAISQPVLARLLGRDP